MHVTLSYIMDTVQLHAIWFMYYSYGRTRNVVYSGILLSVHVSKNQSQPELCWDFFPISIEESWKYRPKLSLHVVHIWHKPSYLSPSNWCLQLWKDLNPMVKDILQTVHIAFTHSYWEIQYLATVIIQFDRVKNSAPIICTKVASYLSTRLQSLARTFWRPI